MKRKFYLFFALILVFFSLFSFSFYSFSFKQQNEERILFFSSAISIAENQQITIHETIVVECLNIEIQHGIYRDLPLYENANSFFPKYLNLKIIDGKMDGKNAIAKKEEKGNNLRIYLGDPDNFISQGIHSFELTYQYDSILRFEDNFEILYLNITGNDWNFPIMKATATILFPENLVKIENFKFKTIEAYTGYSGEKGGNYQFFADDKNPNILYFETTSPLQRNEGFTVYIKWDIPYFNRQDGSFDTKLKKIKSFTSSLLYSNPSIFILFFGSLIIFIYYLIVWALVGKDPKKMKIPPSTNAIENLSASALRFIWKMGFDIQCFTVAIISLASKGYCTLKTISNGFEVKKTDNQVEISEDEEQITKVIFTDDSKSFYFTRSNYLIIQTLIHTFKDYLTKKYKNIYFITNSLYYIFGLITSIIVYLLSAIASASRFEYGFLFIWLTFWTIGVFALINASIQAWKNIKFSGIVNAISITFFCLIFVAAEIFVITLFIYFFKVKSMLITILLSIFLILINSIYFKLLKKPTKEGVSVYEEIEALRRYLNEIPDELKQNNLSISSQIDLNKLLPYTLALDLNEDWFSDLFKSFEQYPSGNFSNSTFHYSSAIPWIISDKSTSYSDIKSFFSFLNSSISSNSSSSSSSGSSGGSSGGGSGGGGGGGW